MLAVLKYAAEILKEEIVYPPSVTVFLADENIPSEMMKELRKKGIHDFCFRGFAGLERRMSLANK